jgi:pimeloyl-ACP methyl ester carboxylesterase
LSAVHVAIGVAGVLAATVLGIAGWLWFSWRRFVSYHAHKGLPLPEGELGRYFRVEILSMITLGLWSVRAWHRDGWMDAEAPLSGPPVLCIHGITQAGSNYWGLRRILARRGRSSMAVSYGRVRRTLVAHVPPVVAALREMDGRGPFDVVAHSMGGVVLRLALATEPDLARNIRRVVTLGSPHFGTAAARAIRIGTVRSLGRRSPEIAEMPPLPKRIRVTTVSVARDLLVYPRDTCHLPGAEHIELPDLGHTGLLTRPEGITRVVAVLEAPDDEADTRTAG